VRTAGPSTHFVGSRGAPGMRTGGPHSGKLRAAGAGIRREQERKHEHEHEHE